MIEKVALWMAECLERSCKAAWNCHAKMFKRDILETSEIFLASFHKISRANYDMLRFKR